MASASRVFRKRVNSNCEKIQTVLLETPKKIIIMNDSVEIKVFDDSNEWVGVIIIDIPSKNKISINFRYGPPIDNSFDKYTFGGHYRCEILDDNIKEEYIPKSSDYDVLIKILLNCLNGNQPIYERLSEIYRKKENKIERF